ncbi:MAG: 50S ribosomal protein L18 [Bacteriovoracaceae bacterium]
MRKPIGRIASENESKRMRRRLSIRKKVSGSADCPRISLFRSNKHLRVQVVDDNSSKTLFSVQTFGKSAVGENNIEGAKVLGAKVAELLKAKKLSRAVFDRAGYKYTGVVASLAASIRENGIQV